MTFPNRQQSLVGRTWSAGAVSQPPAPLPPAPARSSLLGLGGGGAAKAPCPRGPGGCQDHHTGQRSPFRWEPGPAKAELPRKAIGHLAKGVNGLFLVSRENQEATTAGRFTVETRPNTLPQGFSGPAPPGPLRPPHLALPALRPPAPQAFPWSPVLHVRTCHPGRQMGAWAQRWGSPPQSSAQASHTRWGTHKYGHSTGWAGREGSIQAASGPRGGLPPGNAKEL